MPNPNAIVALVSRIKPGIVKPCAEMLKEHPEGFSIEFEDKQSARIGPSERAAGTLEILNELQKIQLPVYVEVEPETREISRLLIPLVCKVEKISDDNKEGADVALEISHARHTLKQSNPEYEELLGTLRKAQESNSWLVITETNEHEIIDVRAAPEKGIPKAAIPEHVAMPAKSWFCRWFGWLCCFLKWFRCISEQKAKGLFNLMSAQTCNPVTVPPPCIPFLYPDDGCWGRAHEMCRLIITTGITPKKVWIYGSLNVQTKNNPNCQVFWGWHVAPTVCVRRGFFCRTEEMVIDPSLFTEPVSKAIWKGVQGDPSAQLVGTSASVFYRSYGGSTTTDPTYAQTNVVLATYRLQLKNRSLSPVGPPPYAHCP